MPQDVDEAISHREPSENSAGRELHDEDGDEEEVEHRYDEDRRPNERATLVWLAQRVLLPCVLLGVALVAFRLSRRSERAESEAYALAGAIAKVRADGLPRYCPTGEGLHAESSGLLKSATTEDPWGTPFAVACSGALIAVTSAGPDGNMDTPDDIRRTTTDVGSPPHGVPAVAIPATQTTPPTSAPMDSPPQSAGRNMNPQLRPECARCEQNRVACLLAVQAGTLPEEAQKFEHPVEAAKQGCVLEFFGCTQESECPR